MNRDGEANEEYVAAWRDLKRRWRLCLFLFLGYLPIGGGIGILLSTVLNSSIPFAIIGGTWFLSVPVSWIFLMSFRCPRCKRPFSLKFGGASQNLFKPRCVHCGIQAGTLHDLGNVEDDIAAINLHDKRNLKKGLIIGIPVCALLLVAIAVATSVGQTQIAKPRLVAEQFLQQVQAHQYQQAHRLLTPQRQSRLKVQALQQQWQSFEKAHGDMTKPKWAGAGNWPTKSVTLYYKLPEGKGKIGGAKIDVVSNGDAWRIDTVTFYHDAAVMFKSRKVMVLSDGK